MACPNCGGDIRLGEDGRKLNITERTVKWHVTLMLEKLGAFDRASAVAKGFDLGLLKTSPPARR